MKNVTRHQKLDNGRLIRLRKDRESSREICFFIYSTYYTLIKERKINFSKLSQSAGRLPKNDNVLISLI